jgi:hypothetical protein
MSDYRNHLLWPSIGAALLLGCVFAAGSSAADFSDGAISCTDFQRGANGTWTALNPTTIAPGGMVISLSAGETFAKNQWVDGVEVTTVLDRNCGNEPR